MYGNVQQCCQNDTSAGLMSADWLEVFVERRA